MLWQRIVKQRNTCACPDTVDRGTSEAVDCNTLRLTRSTQTHTVQTKRENAKDTPGHPVARLYPSRLVTNLLTRNMDDTTGNIEEAAVTSKQNQQCS